jgi:hypothetical protein
MVQPEPKHLSALVRRRYWKRLTALAGDKQHQRCAETHVKTLNH